MSFSIKYYPRNWGKLYVILFTYYPFKTIGPSLKGEDQRVFINKRTLDFLPIPVDPLILSCKVYSLIWDTVLPYPVTTPWRFRSVRYIFCVYRSLWQCNSVLYRGIVEQRKVYLWMVSVIIKLENKYVNKLSTHREEELQFKVHQRRVVT